MPRSLIEAGPEVLADGLARHRFSSLFSSAPRLAAVAESYGLRISAAAHPGGGRVREAVLFSRITDLRGDRIVSLPFCGYAEPLVEDSRSWEDLIPPIVAVGVPIRLRCLRDSIPTQDARFAATATALWHAVDLRRSEAKVWASLDGSARQNIRKAERHGVRVREGRTLADLERFHNTHCRLRKVKYRLPAQPFAFFENLHRHFAAEDPILLLLAEVGGEAVAGTLFLGWGDTLCYKFSASIERALRPNDLLIWSGTRKGRERGLARLDFGLSDADQPGLVRYKRKFATEKRAISTVRWQPPSVPDPRAAEAVRLLDTVTRLLTDPTVPDAITRAGSDVLYRFFC